MERSCRKDAEIDQAGIRTEFLYETAFLIDNNNQTGYSQALREVDSNNEEQVAYTFGDDLVSQSREEVSYLHYDGLGSTRALTSSASALTDTFSYLAFGSILARTGKTQLTHLFTGEAYDFNLGYYYLRARLYNPLSGNFISLDPFNGMNYMPSSLNKYIYANNNPLMYIDPQGNFSIARMSFSLKIRTMLFMILTSATVALWLHFKAGPRHEGKYCESGEWFAEGIKGGIGSGRLGGTIVEFCAHCLWEDFLDFEDRKCRVRSICTSHSTNTKAITGQIGAGFTYASHLYEKNEWYNSSVSISADFLLTSISFSKTSTSVYFVSPAFGVSLDWHCEVFEVNCWETEERALRDWYYYWQRFRNFNTDGYAFARALMIYY